MKRLLFLFSFLFCVSVYGQNGTFNYVRSYYGLVVGSQTQNQSAIVDVQGTNGGFLCPRMTTTERNAIVNPANGLMIYNTSTLAFNYYNGSTWAAVGSAGSVTSVGMTVPSFLSVAGSPITTSGTLAVSLSGTALPVANGGSGLTSYAIGDIIYASGATTISKLPIGTASQQLRVNAGATALEYFTPTGSGITVGTTTITSGTTGSIGMNIGGVYSESISYRAQQAVPGNTHFGFGSASAGGGGSYTGTANTFFGCATGSYITTGSGNVFIGSEAQRTSTTTSNSVIIGMGAVTVSNTASTVAIGHGVNVPSTGSGYHTIIGTGSTIAGGTESTVYGPLNAVGTGDLNMIFGGNSTITGSATGSIIIAFGGTTSLSNTGILGSNQTYGHVDNWYFNGVTHTAPYATALRGSGGSGTNVAGAVLSIIPGIGTGSATTNGYLSISTCPTALGSGTTAQTVTEVVRITKTGDVLILNSVNGLILNDGAGTPHYWRVTIDAAGAIVTTDLGTTIPN